MNNAERIRELLDRTVSRRCDAKLPMPDSDLLRRPSWEVLKRINDGQVLLVSRNTLKSILKELEQRR